MVAKANLTFYNLEFHLKLEFHKLKFLVILNELLKLEFFKNLNKWKISLNSSAFVPLFFFFSHFIVFTQVLVETTPSFKSKCGHQSRQVKNSFKEFVSQVLLHVRHLLMRCDIMHMGHIEVKEEKLKDKKEKKQTKERKRKAIRPLLARKSFMIN